MYLVDAQINARLKGDTTLTTLVPATSIFNGTPPSDPLLPRIVHNQAERARMLPGVESSGSTNSYLLTVHVFAATVDELNNVCAAVENCLDNWSGNNVSQSYFAREYRNDPDEPDAGFGMVQEYDLVVDASVIVNMSSGSGGIVVDGDGIDLNGDVRVCGELLDCDGNPLITPPDLSDYARLSQANTFTGLNTFQATGLTQPVTIQGATGTSNNTPVLMVKSPTGIGTWQVSHSGDVIGGNITGNSFLGSGSQITNLNATNLASGTVADARLTSNVPLKNAANTFTLGQTISPTASGASLTLQAASSGITNTLVVKSSTGVTQVEVLRNNPALKFTDSSGNITFIQLSGGKFSFQSSGTVPVNLQAPIGQIGDGSTTLLSWDTVNSGSTFTFSSTIGTALVVAGQFQGSGASLSALNASQLNVGTVPDARLSSNVPRLSAANTFTTTQTVNPSSNVSALIIKQAASQTADDFQIKNSAGTTMLRGLRTNTADYLLTTNTGGAVMRFNADDSSISVCDIIASRTSNRRCVLNGSTYQYSWGPGDVGIGYGGSGVVKITDGSTGLGHLRFGQLQTSSTAAATTPGSVTNKMPIYDSTGTLVGFVPIYDSIS